MSKGAKPKLMTKAEHRKRHQMLHKALDELAADWLRHMLHYPDKLFSNTPIMELIKWSHQQTLDPTGEHEPEPTN